MIQQHHYFIADFNQKSGFPKLSAVVGRASSFNKLL